MTSDRAGLKPEPEGGPTGLWARRELGGRPWQADEVRGPRSPQLRLTGYAGSAQAPHLRGWELKHVGFLSLIAD